MFTISEPHHDIQLRIWGVVLVRKSPRAALSECAFYAITFKIHCL